MKGLLVAVLFTASLCAQVSLEFTPGVTGTYTLPNSAPWTALTSFRIDLRIQDFATCSGDYSNLWDFGPFALRCFVNGSTSINITDGLTSQGITIPVGGRSDFMLRVMKDATTGVLTGEIWNPDNTGYNLYSTSGITMTPQDVHGVKTVGGTTTTMNLSWVRWYSDLLPVGSRLPLPNIPPGDPTPDLGYWDLEGNLLDSSGRGLNITMMSPVFVATPVYDPVVVAELASGSGTSANGINVTRAGHSTTLTAEDSYSFTDSSTLTYLWVQTAGPTTLSLSGATSPTVSFSNTEFGEYKFDLTVEDSDMNTSTAEVIFGAVATDESGRVIPTDPNVTKIYGPMLRWGLSPWPFLDDREAVFSDFFGEQLATNPNYQDVWNTALAGTVTITNGSNMVTGVGTNFQVDFCGGGLSPASGRTIVFWIPYESRTTRRLYNILSCTSATTMTLEVTYVTTATQTGIQYSRTNCDGCWYGGSDNVNYYDNVMAHYAMHYRTGLTKYLEFAQTLADRWWTSPTIDQGVGCSFGFDAGRACSPPRVLGLTGTLWRAYEGRPDMWAGMETMLNSFNIAGATLIYDVREQGYALGYVSVAAMLDTDAARRATYTATVNAAIEDVWEAFQDPASGIWITWSYGYQGEGTVPPNSVTFTNGSTTVTGSGTVGFWPTTGTGTVGFYIQRVGDTATYYTMPGSTNSTLILDRPYEGTTGSGANYQMNIFVGYGIQPFMLGIAGSGLKYAQYATGSNKARQMILDTADWLLDNAQHVALRGLYYGRIYPPCVPDPNVPNCVYTPPDTEAERYLNGEIVKIISDAYLMTSNSDFKDFGDNIVGAALGGPFGGPDSDAYYVSELGAYTITAGKNKNFGFWFGYGGSYTWPAARLGVEPVNSRIDGKAPVFGKVRIQ